MKAVTNGLGRDFWLFQVGQMISTVGDSCGTIALAWWILDVTGSAAIISTVLAPAMVVQTALTVVLGPLGDRLSKKRLIVVADLGRGLVMGLLALLAARHAFSLSLVVAACALVAALSALFKSNAMSIVPELVSVDSLEAATRTSESLRAIGRVAGGIAGGLLVTWTGVGSAFLVNALSFAVAAAGTLAIQSSLETRATLSDDGERAPLLTLSRDLVAGFRAVRSIPVLFWLCLAVLFLNLILSPMPVLLPMYAKEVKDMPAWFLGALESSIGGGIIVGAVGLGSVERALPIGSVVVVGLVGLGAATALLPHMPGIALPVLAAFALGLSAAWINIPVGMRVTLAVPDHFRSRVSSIFALMFDASAPVGIGLGGALVAGFGVDAAMTSLGVAVLVVTPLLLLIPGFSAFFRSAPDKLSRHFEEVYPQAFGRARTSSIKSAPRSSPPARSSDPRIAPARSR